MKGLSFDGLLAEAESLVEQLRWGWSDGAGSETTAGRVGVVGLPETGKRTLCDSLWGWEVLGGSPVTEPVRDFGLFTVADLPADPLAADGVLFQLDRLDLIIYVVDVQQGLHAADFQWITRLRAQGSTVLVVLNKADTLSDDALAALLADVERRLALSVLPLCATDREMVQATLLPAMLKAAPDLAIPLAAELPGLRRRVAGTLVRQSAVMGWVVSLEPVPLVDASMLVGLQLALVNRLAAVYGRTGRGLRQELVIVVAFSLATRYAGERLAAWLPRAGRVTTASIAALGTYAIGQGALFYYSREWPLITYVGRWKQGRSNNGSTPQSAD